MLYTFLFDDDDQIIYPESQGERQEFLEVLYDVLNGDKEAEDYFLGDYDQKDLIRVYNSVVDLYNKEAKSSIYSHFNKSNMATKKKAAAKKNAAAKKAAPKPKKNGEKSQKQQIVELAEKGYTVDQIVEKTGIQKPNVSSIYSRLGLKKHAKKED